MPEACESYSKTAPACSSGHVDPESLAVGIASVLEDPAMAKRIRTEAKSRVAAYEISNVVDLVEEVYHLAMTIAAAPR